MAIVKYPEVSRTWATLEGKPYITVSAKGVSNGLSAEYNDGADFGPDTTLGATSPSQIGAPYSPTGGQQEAINYAQTNGIGKISYKGEKIVVGNSTIYLNPDGTFTNPLELEGNGITIEPTTSNPLFAVSYNPNNDAGQPLYPLRIHGFVFNANGAPDPNCLYFNQYGLTITASMSEIPIEIYDNIFTGTFGTPIFTENPPYPMFIHDNIFVVQSSGAALGINGGYESLYIYSNSFIADAGSGGSNAIILCGSATMPPTYTLITGNSFTNTSAAPTTGLAGVIAFACYGTSGWNGAIIDKNYFNLTAGWINIISTNSGTDVYNIVISNNFFQTGLVTSIPNYPLIINNTILHRYNFYGNTIFINNKIHQFSGDEYGFINNSLGNVVVVKGNYFENDTTTVGGAAIYFGNVTATSKQTWIIEDNFVDTATSGVSSIDLAGNPLEYFMSIKNNTQNYVGSFTYVLFSPTTPAVPASATAQQNTNPFPVNVYLYGGTVTEIQITNNGTNYTVFSNATGLALSGQVYKLNPSDSITLTYTTAPTWEWLSG